MDDLIFNLMSFFQAFLSVYIFCSNKNEDVKKLKIQHNPFAKAFLVRQNLMGCSSRGKSPSRYQLEDQESQLIGPEAVTTAVELESGQFSSNPQQQQQQHRVNQRFLPYNLVQNKNLQVSSQSASSRCTDTRPNAVQPVLPDALKTVPISDQQVIISLTIKDQISVYWLSRFIIICYVCF